MYIFPQSGNTLNTQNQVQEKFGKNKKYDWRYLNDTL